MELIQTDLEMNLLEKIRNIYWTKLESLVKDIMSAMDYGNGIVTQKTRDGGIDGYIKEDRLGLNVICLQAKRYAENQLEGVNLEMRVYR